MRALLWLPSILADMFTLLLPRWLFKVTYKPAGVQRQQAENDIRNAARLATYKAKKVLNNEGS